MTVPEDQDTEPGRCRREDAVGISVVRCQRNDGHKGPHIYTRIWRDPRDGNNPT